MAASEAKDITLPSVLLALVGLALQLLVLASNAVDAYVLRRECALAFGGLLLLQYKGGPYVCLSSDLEVSPLSSSTTPNPPRHQQPPPACRGRLRLVRGDGADRLLGLALAPRPRPGVAGRLRGRGLRRAAAPAGGAGRRGLARVGGRGPARLGIIIEEPWREQQRGPAAAATAGQQRGGCGWRIRVPWRGDTEPQAALVVLVERAAPRHDRGGGAGGRGGAAAAAADAGAAERASLQRRRRRSAVAINRDGGDVQGGAAPAGGLARVRRGGRAGALPGGGALGGDDGDYQEWEWGWKWEWVASSEAAAAAAAARQQWERAAAPRPAPGTDVCVAGRRRGRRRGTRKKRKRQQAVISDGAECNKTVGVVSCI